VSPLATTRIPIAVGNLVEIAGILFALYLIVMAPEVTIVPLKLILYLAAWGCLLFFPHSLTHYAVGRLVGVRFRYYSFGKSSVYKLKIPFLSMIASMSPVLTLKVDRESLQSVCRGGRIAMFTSGAVASMVFPFFVAFASFRDLPIMFSIFLLLLSAANMLFDFYFSPKAGDISRAISVAM
jgi:hypothetical protein